MSVVTCPHCNQTFFQESEDITVEGHIDRGAEGSGYFRSHQTRTSTQTGDDIVGTSTEVTDHFPKITND
jgi:sarcosine oxidase delta subunit